MIKTLLQVVVLLCTFGTASANILNLQFLGSGKGSISSIPSAISSTGNSSHQIAAATTLTLRATPDAHSAFKGWDGGGCLGTGDCTITLTTDAPIVTVKATFEALRPVWINAPQPNYYQRITDAYQSIGANEAVSIQLRSVTFNESLALNRNLQVKLDGGYNRGYSAKDGTSTIRGSVRVSAGKVVAHRIVIGGWSETNTAPLAVASYDQPAAQGPVILDGSRSYDADGDPLTYSWSIAAKPFGSAAVLSGPTAAVPAFTPDLAGEYTVTLAVSDGKSTSAPVTVTVHPNLVPVAHAGTPRNVVVGDLVTLGGTGSSDANGDPLTYRWELSSRPTGSSARISGASSPNPTFSADRAGAYLATLTVSDGKTESLPATVTVTSHATPSFARNGNFYLARNGPEPVFIKGVNIGAAIPGHFPGELAITKADYLRWFQQIYDMGANTIRIFTAHPPAFYNALHEFNRDKERSPLYFMQGVWVNEEDMATYRDPFASDGKILNDFSAEAKSLVDVIHGNIVLPPRAGHASGTYGNDVSRYMAGWILGVEWEPNVVLRTNSANAGMQEYDGTYLRTAGAQPFEVFLARVGDQVVDYELGGYATQRPLSFVNWVTTDPITHSNEPLRYEDAVSVDVEKIQAKGAFEAGLFASYNVYPYYPDMFSYQAEYINFIDDTGKRNPYRGYLRDLISRHTLPVLITEFGIPSSRGKAHENLVSGFNQGLADEKTQGNQLASMLDDIRGEGYVGALVFSWQDEWFKRTWNTMDFDDPEMRPFWHNAQTNEQQFGLLSFDPGSQGVTLDGQGSEWPPEALVSSQGTRRLYMLSDEKYVYFMVRDLAGNLANERILIPVDVTPYSGSRRYGSQSFDSAADFLISIDGPASRILVHSYYDAFYFLYAERQNHIEKHPEYRTPDNGYFNRMMLPLSKQLFLPVDQRVVPFTAYETGLLKMGIGDPQSPEYDSLSDWYAVGDTLEVRVPWQLLNFRAPPKGEIMDDFYLQNRFSSTAVGWIQAGVNSTSEGETISMGSFNLRKWVLPTYRERLKQSYYIMKEKFQSIP